MHLTARGEGERLLPEELLTSLSNMFGNQIQYKQMWDILHFTFNDVNNLLLLLLGAAGTVSARALSVSSCLVSNIIS